MRASPSLRTRFLLGILPPVVLLTGMFALMVGQFIELLEDELLQRALAQELQEFAVDYQRNADRAAPSGNGIRGFIVRGEQDLAALDPVLAALPEGMHPDVVLEAREFYVGRKDVEGARLYLVLDIEPVEQLERQVVAMAMVSGLLALLLSVLVSLVLARVVMRPVSRLATLVSQLDPRQRGLRLHGRFGDRDVGIIAAALDDYLARLDQVIDREQAFTEDASHELRTPLSIVSSAAQLLAEEGSLSERGRERIERVQRACGQMQASIEALLFLAREDGGAAAQDCALDEAVAQAVDVCRQLVGEHGPTFRVQAEPVTVRTPPGMAAAVVNNLLFNAAHHSGQGVVEVGLRAGELSVRDNGTGIPPQDLARIFDRRFRGAQSQGLGLGLYLVKRICDRLGWSVQARSEPGAGTTFVVRF